MLSVVGETGEASIANHPCSGTHQSKRRARSITNSTRVLHGISFFITLSPSESHNAIFLRCTRLRQSDPFVMHHPELARWYGRTQPSLLHWESGVSEQYPSHEVRRHILSNSAISCVDGFKAHTTLLFKFVFGLKICPRCPWCTCSDGEGKNNEIEGGSAGRMYSVTGSYEFQKKRDEHIHMQCCIECPHSFYSLDEIADLIERSSRFVDDYKSFVDGLCHQRYCSSTCSTAAQYEEAEKTWPDGISL